MGECKPRICILGLQSLPLLARSFTDFTPGGAELQQVLLARAFVKAGYDVCMVVIDLGQGEGSVYDKITAYKAHRPKEGMPIIRFVYPRWVKIWRALWRANADVYYTSVAGMHVGLLAMFCQRYLRKFIYRTSHDNDCEAKELGQRVRYTRDQMLFKFGLRRADAILSQSSKQQELLLKNYGLPSIVTKRYVEIPN